MPSKAGDAQDASRLTGTYWGLVFIRDSGGQTDVSDVNGYLHLSDDGQMSWKVGNSHSGTASITGDRIRYEPETVTAMALRGPRADIEIAVDLVLESRPHWRIDGERLLLHDDAGNSLIWQARSTEQVFRRR
jgi:heat shock protein HslJ